MELKEAIYTRRSIRKFKPDAVPREVILDIINRAAQSPSATNSQPWRFLLVEDREVLQNMHEAVVEEKEKLLAVLSDKARESFAEYSRYFLHFIGAPLVIVPIYKSFQILSHYLRESSASFPLQDIDYMENLSSVVSISLAIQNLLLSTHEKGLGASCMAGPLIANTALSKILSVPVNWHIVLLVAIGYPDEKPAPKPRKPAEQIVKWI